MSKIDDPRVQEALRLLGEVAKEDQQQTNESGLGKWIGWHITETKHANFRFEIKIELKNQQT